ncbi:hypothetical protein KKB84_01590 [bacterium]|nr:hypothetical protein [bacterium]MBU2600423.1 hypothetical protein [bacterium]
MNYLVIFFAVIIFFSSNLWAEEKVIIEQAEELSFEGKEEKRVINLTGNVKLLHEKTTLQAQSVQFFPHLKRLIAEKEVSLKDEDQEVFGDTLSLNLDNYQGQMINISSYHQPTFYKGKVAHIKAKNHYEIEEGDSTTCRCEQPHYTMEAESIDLKIKDRVLAKHIFLKVGGTPIFYLPFWWSSLEDKHTHLSVKPGYSQINGWTTSVKYGYYLNKLNSGLLLLDYYELRGCGWGINHGYNFKDQGKGRLNFYYLKERKEDLKIKKRWNLSNYYYQTFPNDLTLVSNLNYISDKSFSKDYLESMDGFINEITSSISLTRTRPAYTLRGTYDRYDLLDRDKDEMIKKKEKLPEITFDTKKLEIKRSGYYYKVFTQLGRTYQDRYYRNFWEGRVEFLKSYSLRRYKIGKWLSFSPCLGIEGDWKDQESVYQEDPYFNAHYYTNLSLPINFYSGKIRVIPQYSYKRSLKDLKSKENEVKLNYLHPLRKGISFNTTFGYNFLKKEYNNLISQLTLKKQEIKLRDGLNLKEVSFILNKNYSLKNQKIESIEGSLTCNLEKNKKDYYLSLANSYVPEVTWQLKSKFSTNFIKYLPLSIAIWYDLKRQELQQGEIILKRDLHCLESELNIQRYKTYGSKPWETKVLYKINLKEFKRLQSSIFQGGNVGSFGWGDIFTN